MKKYIIYGVISIFIIVSGYIVFKVYLPAQSQKASRFGLGAAKLPIPKDCVKIVSINFVSRLNGKTSKYLTYINTKGELISKEYTDYGILEGKIKWGNFNSSMISK
jgi:hypothetical protein